MSTSNSPVWRARTYARRPASTTTRSRASRRRLPKEERPTSPSTQWSKMKPARRFDHAGAVSATRARSLSLLRRPLREFPVRSREVAGVAPRLTLQVVLVLRLGLPEITCRHDFGDDLARPQPRRLDVGDGVQRHGLLLVVGVEDRRPVAPADVVALPVLGRRVVDLEEELEQRPIVGLRRVVDDLDRLGVPGMIAVGGVGVLATGIADT